MQDEILGRAIVTDESAVPRYRIRDASGNLITDNATIELVNPVEQEGTPINTATLLSSETAQKFKGSIPATVNEALALLAMGQGKTFESSIATSAWSGGLASVTISIDTGSRYTDTLVIIIPVTTSTSNVEAWKRADVKCYENSGTTLRFKASSTPTQRLDFTGVVFEL